MDAVGCTADCEVTIADPDRIIGLKSVAVCVNHICAACDLHIVLACDAVIDGVDVQCAKTVENQIILGEDRRVCIGVTVGCECAVDGQGVFCFCGCHKHLVSGYDIDCGHTVIGDGYTVKHELNLGGIIRFDTDGDICDCSREYIDTFLSDIDILSAG